MLPIASEKELAQLAAAVEAGERAGPAGRLRKQIAGGEDPLGEAFCALRSPALRRDRGATYTPPAIVAAMVAWARERAPARVVDPGVGSGRFLAAAGRAFARAELVGADIDPLATQLARANLAALGLAGRSRVVLGDYRALELPARERPTFFVGNPPYVRHHEIEPRWKEWLRAGAARLGIRASQLAGLHVHFFLQTAMLARPGDFGCFITASEWLDVNYGKALRDLLAGLLGIESLHVIEPTVEVFADAASTAVITCFEVGSRRQAVRLRRVPALDAIGRWKEGREVPRRELAEARRWSPLTRATPVRPAGMVELGELCRVHRGQVTGANDVWVLGPEHGDLPESVLFPAVTKARELFAAGPSLRDPDLLRRVIDLPEDLSALPPRDRKLVDRFLVKAKGWGADRGYIARTRRCWWSVGLRPPAPILATYMARRPPAFVRNLVGARHINIAHGLYPRVPLSDAALDGLVRVLSGSVALADGRTYAGGLTKFEPREMERLLVPMPERLGWDSSSLRAGP